MKKIFIAVLGCLLFGIFLIYRPVKNQQQFSLEYSTIPAKNLSYIRKQTGQELQNAVKNNSQAQKVPVTTSNDPNFDATKATDTQKIAQAMAFARAQIGKPYVWAAHGPDSYDCSGLMEQCYKSAGLNVGWTTYEQVLSGKAIDATDRSKWKSGDLILPNAGHVGMYMGEGKFLHAPQKNTVVKEVDIYFDTPYAVRRIVGD